MLGAPISTRPLLPTARLHLSLALWHPCKVLQAATASPPAPRTPAAAPAATRRRRLAGRVPMSFPRSLDSHSEEGQKAIAAAAERNKEPILAALKPYLAGAPQGGLVLEVASGTGQHVAHFAAGLPQLEFQPTEFHTEDGLASIRAWTKGLPNVRPPVPLDASQPPGSWPVPAGSCRAIFVANMTHISPWAATAGLLAGAGQVLAPRGELFLYGPFSVDGKPTTESNAAFDANLRQRNPQWGYRDVADIASTAMAQGLTLVDRLSMPANNFLLVLRKD